MTEHAGLRGFTKALSRPLDDQVVNALKDIAKKCAAARDERPRITVRLNKVHRYIQHYTHYTGVRAGGTGALQSPDSDKAIIFGANAKFFGQKPAAKNEKNIFYTY